MPKYITGAMNYNPVVRFTSGNYMLLASRYFYQYDNSQFIVYRTNANTGTLTALGTTVALNPTFCDKIMSISG